MSYNDRYDDEQEERGFFQRFGFVIGIVVLVGAGVMVVAGRNLFPSSKTSMHKSEFKLDLPKLPPPPTPPPPPPPEQKMRQEIVQQVPVEDNEEKPDDKPADAAPDLSTNNTGPGGPDFGLRKGGGNGAFQFGHHGSGSKWGWYAAKLNKQTKEAIQHRLEREARTKTAVVTGTAKIWPDPVTGRITRATFAGGTGDSLVDDMLKKEVSEALTGFQLDEPPPPGMPSPIVLRVTARRP